MRAGNQLGVNGKATGSFYSEEAARLALEAAQRPKQPAAPAPKAAEPAAPADDPAAPSYVPPILLNEPRRRPLAPEPAINQNRPPERDEPVVDEPVRASRPARQAELYLGEDTREDDERHLSVARIIAWIILTPWALAMLAASLAILGLVARNFFGA